MLSQQNEKSSQLYSTKSWIRGLAITVGMEEVCYQRQWLKKSQEIHLKVY